ncbi:MAG: hypothetical protein ACFFCW_22785 [Candidatus Hodarchaeota archaeon]
MSKYLDHQWKDKLRLAREATEEPICPYCNYKFVPPNEYTIRTGDAVSGILLLLMHCPQCGKQTWVRQVIEKAWWSIRK